MRKQRMIEEKLKKTAKNREAASVSGLVNI